MQLRYCAAMNGETVCGWSRECKHIAVVDRCVVITLQGCVVMVRNLRGAGRNGIKREWDSRLFVFLMSELAHS